MGEVRVKVRLTNAADLALLRKNVIPVDEVHTYEAGGLVDTGAVTLVVPSAVAAHLDLVRFSKQVAMCADGREEEVDVAGPVSVEIMGRQMTTDALILGDEVIIGQIVLEMTDLFVDPLGHRLVPNPAHPDQPVLKVK
ncbi:MAG: Peptidase aspartic [Chloroflexi bacterium]|nr:Peptidase aspartic [Chloroflexota bacterium]